MDFMFDELLEETENNLFKYQYSDDSLKTMLNNLSKKELLDIKRFTGISGSNNLKKAEIAEKIFAEINSSLSELLYLFNDDHLNFIKEFLKSDNYIIYDNNNIELSYLSFFNQLGIIFPLLKGKEKVIIMPKEIKQFLSEFITKEYEELIEHNTGLLVLLYGYTNLYGLFSLVDVEPFKFFEIDLLETVSEIIMFDYLINSRICIKEDSIFVYHPFLDDNMDEFIDKYNDSLEYYHYTTDEIIDASWPNYLEKNDGITKLKNLFKFELNADEEYLDYFLSSLQTLLKMGLNAKEVFDFINDEEADLPYSFQTKLIKILNELEKTIRKWTLKGHREIDLINKDKQDKFIKFPSK